MHTLKYMRMRELPPFFGGYGFKIGYGTLKKMSARGEGPPYRWWGHHKLFGDEAALAWAERNLSDERKAFNPNDRFKQPAAAEQK
jgi:hypothetical protein